jgi:tetratricopeptide (TPR) repeat protein
MGDPIAVPDSLNGELQALERLSRLSSGTCSFTVAVCNSLTLRRTLLARVPGIFVAHLSPDTLDPVATCRAIVPTDCTSAIAITGLEELLSTAHPSAVTFAGILNRSRERWRAAFPGQPLIFWASDQAAGRLFTDAPDFRAWVSHDLEFPVQTKDLVSPPSSYSPGEPGASAGEFRADLSEKAILARIRAYVQIAFSAQRLYMAGGDKLGPGLSQFDEVRPHLESAFAWLQPRTDEVSARLLINLVGAVAFIGNIRFHPRQQLTWHETKAQAARLTGDRAAEGAALGSMGLAHAALGDASQSLACHKQNLSIAEEIGDRRGEGSAWGNMGNAYGALGDARSALVCYKKSLQISKEIGDRRSEGNGWGNVGLHHRTLGDETRALECFEQQMTIAKEIGDRRGEANARGNIGNAHTALGEARRALQDHEEALTIIKEIGDIPAKARVLFNSAAVLWNLDGPGERNEARRRMAEAAEIFTIIESPAAEQARAVLADWDRA